MTKDTPGKLKAVIPKNIAVQKHWIYFLDAIRVHFPGKTRKFLEVVAHFELFRDVPNQMALLEHFLRPEDSLYRTPLESALRGFAEEINVVPCLPLYEAIGFIAAQVRKAGDITWEAKHAQALLDGIKANPVRLSETLYRPFAEVFEFPLLNLSDPESWVSLIERCARQYARNGLERLKEQKPISEPEYVPVRKYELSHYAVLAIRVVGQDRSSHSVNNRLAEAGIIRKPEFSNANLANIEKRLSQEMGLMFTRI